MNRWQRNALRFLPILLGMTLSLPQVVAQQNAPHAAYVYPAGGRQGASFEVTVGGQHLSGASSTYVSDSGVSARVLQYVKPLTPAEASTLREQLKELTARKAAANKQPPPNGAQGSAPPSQPVTWTAEDERTVAEIRHQLANFVRQSANPALAETVTLQITVAPDASLGERELRLATAAGLTNPVLFCVGQLPEVSKRSAGTSNETASAWPPRRNPVTNAMPAEPVDVTLPAVLNGQIMPAIADRYRFQARKGQRLVIAASAQKLIPYIADAVPGWLQAALTLYDTGGKQVAYADHFLFHPDPVLYYEVPRDGQYTLEIKDTLYRGREDFVYRITLGELPFLTGIFPLGGKAGARTKVELSGWNLPVSKLTHQATRKERGVEPIYLGNRNWISNSVPFALDTLPECREKEPNDRRQSAQRVNLPIIVNGRIDRPGDWDMFRFEGRAGEEIVAEVLARRLGSPLDSVLQLTDAAGRELASNDDYADKGAGLVTHQADSRIAFKLPANGTYYLRLGDVQGKGGPEYAYRLRISQPEPDFELRVVPASLNIRSGSSLPFTVYALRRDGFAGEIAFQLKDAPPGFSLAGAVVPANEDQVRLTLTVPPGAIDNPRVLSLEGYALIQGRDVRRPGIPAEDMMQAFAYHHLVPAKELLVWVPGPSRSVLQKMQWISFGDKSVTLPAGGTVQVQLACPQRVVDQVRLVLNQPPDGISIENLVPVPGGVTIRLRAEPNKPKPGFRGNLIFDAFLEPPVNPADKTNPRRQPLGTLPALPLEIVSAVQRP